MKRKIVTLVVAVLLAATAYAGTAFYTGERTSGMNKVCYYDYLGSTYTANVRSYQMCPTSIRVEPPSYAPQPYVPTIPPPPSLSCSTAFYTGEETTGLTKVCYYDYLGDTYTKTVSSVALCPLNAQVCR